MPFDDHTPPAQPDLDAETRDGRAAAAPAPDATRMCAPDRLAVWPMDDGRFGFDAHYFGATGLTRAQAQSERFCASGVRSTVRKDADGSLLRLGPIDRRTLWRSLEAFLGWPAAAA